MGIIIWQERRIQQSKKYPAKVDQADLLRAAQAVSGDEQMGRPGPYVWRGGEMPSTYQRAEHQSSSSRTLNYRGPEPQSGSLRSASHRGPEPQSGSLRSANYRGAAEPQSGSFRIPARSGSSPGSGSDEVHEVHELYSPMGS